MNLRAIKIVPVLLMLILYSGLFAQTQIAVAEFKSQGLSKQDVAILTDRLVVELFRTNRFRVLEREMLDKIILEQKFQLSGCNSDECLVELGQIANVEQIVGGSISKLGDVYSISARLISVETGELIRTGIYDYEGKIGKLITIGMANVAAQLASIPVSIQGTLELPHTQTTKQSINSRVASTPKPKNDETSKRRPSTSGSAETVTDIDGNVYSTVTIGEQEWMVENLKVTHYRDGTQINYYESHQEWSKSTSGAYCYYGNNSSNADTYGALYNWYAVNGDTNGDGVKDKEIAPVGWHVPTDYEWKELEITLGMSPRDLNDVNKFRDINAGSILVNNGEPTWKNRKYVEFGPSGFTVVLGGSRGGMDYNDTIGTRCEFWSATESRGRYAWSRDFGYGLSIRRSSHGKGAGCSVRLIRD